ncbi:MAG: right-handed parallel beta-helix repeat-containing protein [Nanoarchaeota archaeon]|nr:right-handed parallel beta-helix repeat-containing protein [Nanoarchaeota archaeon]
MKTKILVVLTLITFISLLITGCRPKEVIDNEVTELVVEDATLGESSSREELLVSLGAEEIIEEETEDISASTGGGGSSGSSTTTSSDNSCSSNADCSEDKSCYDYQCVKLFDIKVIDVDSPVGSDGQLHFTYFIKGMADINNDVIINFWLEHEEEVISSGSDTIYMGSFEEKTEVTKIFIPTNISTSAYDFYVQVSFESYQATSHRTIFVEDSNNYTITPICGDDTCDAGEDSASCLIDCPAAPVCGDGLCEDGETCSADCTVSEGDNYYVSPSGSDDNDCATPSTACREIRKALTLVSPGETILVADGEYLGFTVDNLDGLPGQPITIKAEGSGAVITPTTDRGSPDRDNIFITFSDYIIIDGLTSFNAPRAGIRVDGSHNVIVKNGVFGNNGRWGIFTNHANNILIENNEAYGSVVQHGIYFSNSADNPTIRGNLIHDNTQNGLHVNGDLSSGGHAGVEGDGIISGALIENNIIYNNGLNGAGAAINMDGIQDSVIRNNLLYNNHAGGITLYRINGAAGGKNVQFYHNTIDMASDTTRWALQVDQSDGPVTIRNNIIYNRNPDRGVLQLMRTTDGLNTDTDYNVFGGFPYIYHQQLTLDEWQTWQPYGLTPDESLTWEALGRDLHSLIATSDELFVGADDYHLVSSAPAIDAGINVDVLSDIEGNTRSANPSIGCYE